MGVREFAFFFLGAVAGFVSATSWILFALHAAPDSLWNLLLIPGVGASGFILYALRRVFAGALER